MINIGENAKDYDLMINKVDKIVEDQNSIFSKKKRNLLTISSYLFALWWVNLPCF